MVTELFFSAYAESVSIAVITKNINFLIFPFMFVAKLAADEQVLVVTVSRQLKLDFLLCRLALVLYSVEGGYYVCIFGFAVDAWEVTESL